ncbi:hypothetical protein HZP39_02910 [Elizabethkingia anophelis]|uniref:Uncharacterized protein n=1 Tax=Elizabethkingia anophelis NUHP1 TaxID=1338011 RepID=A0A077EDN0_9FLAO|nr:hypothetical protein [Elizabethkingia anophelis]AIL45656.1 hypothetical protein BD94_1881 [Elizabethkingia anophelis NUHP1]ASV78960.1 hypothetical protein A6J37_10205 [Elizabethkingia anophelis]AVF49280.1 hypothetical protein AL491_14870 [Elizabethkingia anophelis]AVF53276.1 hypothetical protein AL492_17280 [Elizabethkingia anophelis]EHM7981558.1 hypothetical protein [Elizabethkingia anophelis]
MMKEKESVKTDCRETYTSPTLSFSFIEMENGIAAGSAKVIPSDNGGKVQEEWQSGTDDNRTIDW